MNEIVGTIALLYVQEFLFGREGTALSLYKEASHYKNGSTLYRLCHYLWEASVCCGFRMYLSWS